MPASAPITFPFPYHVVMDAIPRILPSSGFPVLGQDPPPPARPLPAQPPPAQQPPPTAPPPQQPQQ